MNLAVLEELVFRALLKARGTPIPASLGLGPKQLAELPQSVQSVALDTLDLTHRLLTEAYKNGFPEFPDPTRKEVTNLLGGAVAQFVGKVSASTDFALKADNSPDLAEQAQTLRYLHDSRVLPAEYRKLFPRVYAALLDGPPFAYLMEFFGDGFTKLSHYIFRKETSLPPESVVVPLVKRVFEMFERTKQRIFIPNVDAIYVERVTNRLRRARVLNAEFKKVVESKTIIINSEEYPQCDIYLSAIAKKLPRLQPVFSTFVHGDMHPGNIFFKGEGDLYEVKFIDPKSWIWGDYLFDVGKLLHYTMVTGPREDEGIVDDPDIQDGPPPSISYEIRLSDRAQRTIDLTRSRLNEFAASNGDPMFEPRLELSLASNLLGLCENRLVRGLYKNAVLFYCEGLRHLRNLVKELI